MYPPYRAPRWLPDDYLQRPSGVWFAGVEHEDFGFLRDLPTLETACLVSCPGFDDSDLATLSGLRQLTFVSLIGSRVTNDGLAHLAPLRRLRILQLRGTQIDDGAVPRLEKTRFVSATPQAAPTGRLAAPEAKPGEARV